MKIDKDQLALRRASVAKGMRMQSDCPITTPYTAPGSDLSEIRQRLAALEVKIKQAAEIARRART